MDKKFHTERKNQRIMDINLINSEGGAENKDTIIRIESSTNSEEENAEENGFITELKINKNSKRSTRSAVEETGPKCRRTFFKVQRISHGINRITGFVFVFSIV